MVEIGDKVKVDYRAMLEDGTEFGSTYRDGRPLEVVVGSGKSVPGIEKLVIDMVPGETREITLPPEQAYGAYDENLIEMIPYDQMPNADQLPVGRHIGVRYGEETVFMKVLKIEDGWIYLDFNHELADKTIKVEVTLLEVETRDAIDREKHPVGCACGCDRLKEALG